MQIDFTQTLEETFKKEIKLLNKQLYEQYNKNQELLEKIKYLQDKITILEEELEQFAVGKLKC